MGSEVIEGGSAALAADPSWHLVQRVAASAYFQKSPRLQELLLYICEHALLNRPEDLREQLIGCRVFGRKPDYSPGDDNIVRVEVRRLRKRLEEYFAAEGLHEPILITVPKGSYVPSFQPRPQQVPEPPPAPAPAAIPVAPRNSLFWRWPALAGVVVMALLAGWMYGEHRRADASAAGGLMSVGDREPLWPLLFNRNQQTLVVCADSALVMAQKIRGGQVSLDAYVKRDYASNGTALTEDIRNLLGVIPDWQFTDIADVRIVERLHRLNASASDRISVHTARTTQIQDFTAGNVVLLGSVQSNPWNHLFEQQLNFQVEFDDQIRTAFVRNRAPLRGEKPVYGGAAASGPDEVYSTIAFMPNLRRTGHVLIVAGTNSQGTETAGEYITTRESYAALMRMLAARNGGELPYFEVLLRSRVLAGVARNAEVVASRILLPGPKGN